MILHDYVRRLSCIGWPATVSCAGMTLPHASVTWACSFGARRWLCNCSLSCVPAIQLVMPITPYHGRQSIGLLPCPTHEPHACRVSTTYFHLSLAIAITLLSAKLTLTCCLPPHFALARTLTSRSSTMRKVFRRKIPTSRRPCRYIPPTLPFPSGGRGWVSSCLSI